MTQNMVCMYPTTLVVNFHPEYSVHGMYVHTVLYLPLHTYIQRIPRSTPKLWKWSVKVKNPLRQRKHSTKVFFSLNGEKPRWQQFPRIGKRRIEIWGSQAQRSIPRPATTNRNWATQPYLVPTYVHCILHSVHMQFQVEVGKLQIPELKKATGQVGNAG